MSEDIVLEEGKFRRVEKAEVYAKMRIQWDAIETNKNMNNIILFYIFVMSGIVLSILHTVYKLI